MKSNKPPNNWKSVKEIKSLTTNTEQGKKIPEWVNNYVKRIDGWSEKQVNEWLAAGAHSIHGSVQDKKEYIKDLEFIWAMNSDKKSVEYLTEQGKELFTGGENWVIDDRMGMLYIDAVNPSDMGEPTVCHLGKDNETNRKRAAIIAAAPSMYMALLGFIHWWDNSGQPDECRNTATQAKAIIDSITK